MTDDPEDNWPLPDYSVGQHYHVHALGVISLLVAQFGRSIDSLHAFHWREQKAPEELIDLYYYSLNEEQRVAAIDRAFQTYEQDPAVKQAIKDLLAYFHWCRDARNKLLHAEQYPAAFGGNPKFLYLIKRMDKRSRRSGYMKLTLEYLRSIADTVRAGIVQSATIDIYLRLRGLPLQKIDRSLRQYASEPLPQSLPVPPPLRLTDRP
jgi:hypothetical protein